MEAIDDHQAPRGIPPFRAGPVSSRGRWARRFLIAGVGLWFLASALTGLFGRRDAGTIDDVMRVAGPILGVALVATGIGALTTALLALTRDRERSWVVWVGLAYGVLGVLFLLGELLLPH